MKVVAIAKGYGGIPKMAIREEGDEFNMPDGAKGSWFVPVENQPATSKKPGGKNDKAKDDDLA